MFQFGKHISKSYMLILFFLSKIIYVYIIIVKTRILKISKLNKSSTLTGTCADARVPVRMHGYPCRCTGILLVIIWIFNEFFFTKLPIYSTFVLYGENNLAVTWISTPLSSKNWKVVENFEWIVAATLHLLKW